MSARKIRRAAAVKARKLARKSAASVTPAVEATTTNPLPIHQQLLQRTIDQFHSAAATAAISSDAPSFLDFIPQPGYPDASLASISPARLAANRENAKKSQGALTDETKATSAQNHTIHGLARHQNGNFKILTSEDAGVFESFKQSLIDEHAPTTPTEAILVNTMAESHWLAQRAQRLQDTCTDPASGAVTDEKKFSLYIRYRTTHTRAFHKCLSDLQKLRKQKHQAQLGVEAQSVKKEAQRVATERHEIKKDTHYWTVQKKDAEACREIMAFTKQNIEANRTIPGFQAQYDAELAKRGLEMHPTRVAVKVA